MQFRTNVLTLLAVIGSATAFAPPTFGVSSRPSLAIRSNNLVEDLVGSDYFEEYDFSELDTQLNYKAGQADTEFAKKFRHLVGARVKTVSEAFAEFTRDVGYTINPLYKNLVTDLVGTVHLIVVDARFVRNPIWSLGIVTTLELLLKTYPERDIAERIEVALYKCIGMDVNEIRAEAKIIEDWVKGKTREDIENALSSADPSNPIGAIAKEIKDNIDYWKYSRYFGIGLLKIMDFIGIEMEKDEVYNVMEFWASEKLGIRPNLPCNDSDLYFKAKAKLEMMETMMKEVEIREKKRMAERLERKAEDALLSAEREEKMLKEIEEEARASRERVASS